MNVHDWKRFADAFAHEAHTNHSHSHQGIWFLERADVLVFYNNHPWEHGAEELSILRELLAAAGIKELAFGSYPPSGEKKGLTYTVVIDASRDRQGFVANLAQHAILEAWRRFRPGHDSTEPLSP